jgi:hypothetical protein
MMASARWPAHNSFGDDFVGDGVVVWTPNLRH